MKTIAALLNSLPQVGRLEWIGLRSERLGAVTIVNEALLVAERGLSGDHRFSGRRGARRQVTLIQSEHLVAVAGMLHRDDLRPELVRRNLVVSGINLLAFKGKRFRIGTTLLEYSGPCEPCSRMESVLGPGGYNAMRGHGGITAKVIEGGTIQYGDEVLALVEPPAA
jgi:MOSC domain-containing protein YiiM